MAEGDATEAPIAVEGEAAQPGQMSLMQAVQEVLKKALIHDGLARGLRECAKALDKRQAHLCVLAANCSQPEYVKLVEALCKEHNINLIKVADAKQLGEWVGLCKFDKVCIPAVFFFFFCWSYSFFLIKLITLLIYYYYIFDVFRSLSRTRDSSGLQEAKPRKVRACSCVVVKDFGEESEALNVLLNHFLKK
jgi:small subunit ribosomal protein S12e